MKRSFFRPRRKLLFSLIAAVLWCIGGGAIIAGQVFAEGAASEDRTLSPYFFVNSEDATVDRLPLKSTSVIVNISGVIADVVVTQVYKNEGKKPLEAIYVFPASTRASVHGMKMTIGERTITAKVEKKEEARQSYEQAKKENKTASLLEQERPNVFRMNVANIMPGDLVKTELRYAEAIVSTDGVYEFVYPTVVGPRYSNQPSAGAPASEKWSQNPYLHEGEQPPYSFDIKVRVDAGVPIREMSCPSHKARIAFEGENIATVEPDPGDHSAGNRDFILRCRLAGEGIESGLLLYEGKDENFFYITAQPPKRVTAERIVPREYIFIVDVSGSMSGFPLEISKKLAGELLSGLHPTDLFNVMTFSGASDLFSDRSVPATPENIGKALGLIQNRNGAGGTELLPALKRALDLPRSDGFARTVVIATDGYVTVEPEVFDCIRNHLGAANIFPFGIGTAVNRYIIEGMARVGAGEPFVVTRADEAAGMAEKFRKYTEAPVLTHIKLDFKGFKAYEVDPRGVPDIFSERPVVVCGKWKGKPEGTITLSGLSGRKRWEKRIEVNRTKPSAGNAALRYLWARSRITTLSDYNRLKTTDERVAEITRLGLAYNLLTAFTSFVAIDAQPRRPGGKLETVKQPLPLPAGVSDSALPGRGGAAGTMLSRAPYGYRFTASRKTKPRRHGEAEDAASVPAPLETAMKTNPSGASADSPSGRGTTDPSRSGRLVIESFKVAGGKEDGLRRLVEQKLYLLAGCFSGRKAPSGLTLRWTVKSNGEVANVGVLRPDGLAEDVSGCVADNLKKWRFPAPEGGGSLRVEMTLKFRG